MKTVFLLSLLLCEAWTLPKGQDELQFKRVYVDPLVEHPDIDVPRITNGHEAVPHSIPYQAYLIVTGATGSWLCGGSLISAKYVLTAGHCVDGGTSAQIYLGAHNVRVVESTQIRLISTNLTTHEDFDLKSILNDIGIIELPDAVELNENVNVISLPSRAAQFELYEGEEAKVSGWGLTAGDDDHSTSPVLLEVNSTVISNNLCNAYYGIVKDYQNEGPQPNNHPNLRVIGGNTVTPHSIPHQVFLNVTSDSDTWRCGGSLITTNYILTAASCLHGASHVDILLGAYDISEDEPTQVKVQSNNITYHENFNMAVTAFVYENDIAVISLPEPVILNEAVQTVKLPSPQDTTDTYADKTGKTTGWGLTDAYNASSYSPVLLAQENTIISNEVCRLVYYDLKDYDVCMKTSGDSPCVGDYGSALTVDGVQVGIVSQGVMYCIPGYPYLYTRVSSFLDWIREHTDYQVDGIASTN